MVLEYFPSSGSAAAHNGMHFSGWLLPILPSLFVNEAIQAKVIGEVKSVEVEKQEIHKNVSTSTIWFKGGF